MSASNFSPPSSHLENVFASVCANFTENTTQIEHFGKLSRRLLELCDTRSLVLALKANLYRISLEPLHRLPPFLVVNEKARLRLKHIPSTMRAVSVISSQIEHSALRVVSGGPVNVYVLSPDSQYVSRDAALTYRQIYAGALDQGSLVLSAGSAAFVEPRNDAVVVEVLSQPILPYSVKVNRHTCDISSVEYVDSVVAKRSLLEAAQQSMLRC